MARASTLRSRVPVPAAPKPPTNGTVDFINPRLTAVLPQYDVIRDCIAGSAQVKDRRTVYLPQPNAYDQSAENTARYAAYIVRAVFYNVTKRTLAGMVGQVFLVEPVVTVPTLLDPVVKDANGNGVPLVQLAQQAEALVISYGRSGILADFPKVDGNTSRREQLDGKIRPTITCYEPWNIINWRTLTRGSKILLSLVVLKETYEKADDGFQIEYGTQYRVLRLINNVYVHQIWREGTSGTTGTFTITETQPRDSAGNLLDEIPFTFIGAEDNSAKVDDPPLYDLATINIAHYRNSADYEESVYIAGQATPVIAGLTQAWVKDVFPDGRLELGSRAAIMLPENGSATLLQMEANGAPFEAMEHKERQMVALGAKLVEQSKVQRTATEAGIDEASESSTLQTITNNVSAAFLWALEWCSIFAGATTKAADATTTSIVFDLNTDFDLSGATPEEIKSTIEAWQQEAITFSEMRAQLKTAGLATLDDAEALKEIADQRMAEVASNKAMGLDPIGGIPVDPNANPNADPNANQPPAGG